MRFGGGGVGDSADLPASANAAPLAHQALIVEQIGLYVEAVKTLHVPSRVNAVERYAMHGVFSVLALQLICYKLMPVPGMFEHLDLKKMQQLETLLAYFVEGKAKGKPAQLKDFHEYIKGEVRHGALLHFQWRLPSHSPPSSLTPQALGILFRTALNDYRLLKMEEVKKKGANIHLYSANEDTSEGLEKLRAAIKVKEEAKIAQEAKRLATRRRVGRPKSSPPESNERQP